MKKFLLSTLLLALPMLASAYDCQVDGIYYNLNSEEKTAEVTYQSKDLYDNITSVYTGSVDIPEIFTYEGVDYSVTGIGDRAFSGCSGLTSVTIPNSVTSVADNAFYGCSSLPVEDGIKYAGTILLGVVDKSQNSYTIKEGTRIILSYAFEYCNSMTSIIIPTSVTSIGNYAFAYCSNLISVIIGDNVTKIGHHAFYDCRYLASVTIGNSVERIEYGTFGNCMSLSSIVIPNSVTSIYGDWDGMGAFANCTGLISVTIPNSVTYIGDSTFSRCTNLTSVTIPNSVTTIGNYAFSGCSGLTTIAIGNSVTTIGCNAFYGCTALTSVHITDLISWCKISYYKDTWGALTNPLYYAHHLFLNGEEIKDLVIPSSMTHIGSLSFCGCSSLTSITIPSSVTSIGGGAFYECSGLTSIICMAEDVPETAYNYDYESTFTDFTYNNAILYVSENSLSKYKTTEPWSYFKYIKAIGDDSGIKKCATPTISYADKELTFSCETEGVEYKYTITDSDVKTDYASKVSLSATYEISVYAMKEGLWNSDVATATLVWTDAIFTETTEKPTSAKAVTESIPVLISSQNGTITVKCEQEGQPVAVYTTDGKMLGTAKVSKGQASISTNLQNGQVAIVKVGNRSVKITAHP